MTCASCMPCTIDCTCPPRIQREAAPERRSNAVVACVRCFGCTLSRFVPSGIFIDSFRWRPRREPSSDSCGEDLRGIRRNLGGVTSSACAQAVLRNRDGVEASTDVIGGNEGYLRLFSAEMVELSAEMVEISAGGLFSVA